MQEQPEAGKRNASEARTDEGTLFSKLTSAATRFLVVLSHKYTTRRQPKRCQAQVTNRQKQKPGRVFFTCCASTFAAYVVGVREAGSEPRVMDCEELFTKLDREKLMALLKLGLDDRGDDESGPLDLSWFDAIAPACYNACANARRTAETSGGFGKIVRTPNSFARRGSIPDAPAEIIIAGIRRPAA